MLGGGALRALRPLIDFVEPIDTPLYNFLKLDELLPGYNPLEKILVSNAWTDLGDDSFTMGADFYLKGLKHLHLPGIDQIKLSFNSDDSATGVLVCGSTPSFTLEDLKITLEIDAAILSDRAGNDAAIVSTCAVSIDENGFHFRRFGKASLVDAVIGKSGIGISLLGIELDPGPGTFLKIEKAEVTLPMFADDAGIPLVLKGEKLAFGREGPSGILKKSAGPPVNVKLHDFACEIAEASVTLSKGRLVEAELNGRMDLSAFLADSAQTGWVSASFHVGPSGVTAALSADGNLIEMRVDGAFALAVNTIRLDAADGADAVLWLSGILTPEMEGAEGGWPEFEFDEIGITSKGGIRLAEGAAISTTQPFSVRWHFARLTVTSFTLQRPKAGASGDLELRLSAGVELLQGLPAGASVDGLVVTKRSGMAPTVRFDGIGIQFGSPGAFDAAVTISWHSEDHRFSGSGHLDIPSLDLRLEVVFAAAMGQITTVFAAAEMSLPGGIPIGTTGLSLYAISGLLAYNKEINLAGHTGPRRYFDRFNDSPKGFAAEDKWMKCEGAKALGLGVVLGTGDDGWAFSCRGALLLTLPDIAILATATGDLVSERQSMDGGEGKLTAALAILPAEQLMRFDFSVAWKEDELFEVDGDGGGEFHFDRPLDWMVFAGQKPPKGKPISARALRMDDSFLLSTDYWFRIDAARSANIGFETGIDWRYGPSGLDIELAAHVTGDVTLAWNPSQLEGLFDISGRARLVGGGLSLTVDFSATPSLQVARPKELKIPLKACVEINLWLKSFALCLAYTIEFVDRAPPKIEPFVHGLSAVPRYWTPRLTTDPQAPHDSGIVSAIVDTNHQTVDLGNVQPHSELVLEFSKSMAVALRGRPAALNDVATPFPTSIGSQSRWAAAWTLTGLELTNVTDKSGTDLFGTFSRSPVAREQNGKTISPRPPNTELRLLSSRRFGQDGSLGGGGAEQAPHQDCSTRPTKVRKCIGLEGLNEGLGQLKNGWTCAWRYSGGDRQPRSNRYGVRLAPEDRFTIFAPATVEAVYVTFAEFDASSKPVSAKEVEVPYSVPPGVLDFQEWDVMLVQVCWDELVVDIGAGPTQSWQGSTNTEEWTLVDSAKRLLVPDRAYELDVAVEAQLFEGENARGGAVAFDRKYTFRTARAPDWSGALGNALAGKYPDDGNRPVFRDYDLLVRFKDDFYEALYRLDKRTLGVRVSDANGTILHGPNGTVLLPTSWVDGAITRPPNEEWWGKHHAGSPSSPCEQAKEVSGPSLSEGCFRWLWTS
jgi:hypothetical protein